MDTQWKYYVDDGYFRYPSSRTISQCQLCNKIRRTFYCKNCVRNGDFVHSTSHFSERFAEKRSAVVRKLHVRNEWVVEADKHIEKLRLRENKMEDILLRKEKMSKLRSLLAETEKKLQRKKEVLEMLKEYNRSGVEDLKRNEECKEAMAESVSKIMNERPVLADKLNLLKPQLKSLIRRRTDELVQFIFPINEVQLTKLPSACSESQEKINNDLAEATRTAYVRGRWVFTDSWGETQHSIVAPSLPATGDYAPYIHWVSANKDNALAMTNSSVDHNPAYNISAALTYTTQLVNIIAYYLGIRLPNRIFYSEFCTKTLNERKFVKCVTQLNANVLMLCLSQNVDPHLLQPSQTLRNVLLLLKQSDLGRLEIADIATSSVSYLEDQLTHQMKAATARLSLSDVDDDDREPAWTETLNNDDDNDEYDSDWEAVPLVACPEAMPGSNVSRRLSTQSSIATGLVTSAATSIVSLFRGWNNR